MGINKIEMRHDCRISILFTLISIYPIQDPA